MNRTICRWAWIAAWRQQPGALLAAVLAIAMGVALALGIDLVNRTALHRFSLAINTINGAADLQVTTPDGRLPDQILGSFEQHPQVKIASPVIDTRVTVVPRSPGQANRQLQVIGIDIFRAARITPSLMPQPDDPDSDNTGNADNKRSNPPSGTDNPLFANNSVFLSAAALSEFDQKPGQPLTILVNNQQLTLRIAGTVPGVPPGQALAVMDIGTAQWLLAWQNTISRIDLRVQENTTADSLRAAILASDSSGAQPSGSQPNWQLNTPDQTSLRMANLSRAYRVNLNVLALVALFTGGFIVYATMSLTSLRLAPTLAMLNVLGAQAILPLTIIVGLALVLGVVGAVLGIGLGIGLAQLLLGYVGGDLGGGYFGRETTTAVIPWLSVAAFAGLGIAAAIAGALAPALALRSMAPAQTLRSGFAIGNGHQANYRVTLLLVIAGAVLQFLPPIGGLPLPSYLAIACWLFAGVAFTGPLSAWVVRMLSANGRATWRNASAWLASQRLISAKSSTVAALAGVVASFALVSAMAIMVHSFRVSVADWLDAVLPADIFLRVPVSAAQAGLDANTINTISNLPGVGSVSSLRVIQLITDPSQPAVAVLARQIRRNNPELSLPVTGTVLQPANRRDDCITVYASEPAAMRFQLAVGDLVGLPLTLKPTTDKPAHTRDKTRVDLSSTQTIRTPVPCFQVAAIWRDYARQHGAFAIHQEDYQALTGDQSVSDLAINLTPDTAAEPVMQAIRAAMPADGLQMRTASDIRQLSLKIFDRSFAVTYALEAVALLVGLFGVATTYAGEALSRVREFGMLRHLGLTRAAVARTFAFEAGFSIALGVAWGTVLGGIISQVLIHRVNPQSFHWTMQTHWPVPILASAALALLILGIVTAVIAARRASGHEPIAAVRSDW